MTKEELEERYNKLAVELSESQGETFKANARVAQLEAVLRAYDDAFMSCGAGSGFEAIQNGLYRRFEELFRAAIANPDPTGWLKAHDEALRGSIEREYSQYANEVEDERDAAKEELKKMTEWWNKANGRVDEALKERDDAVVEAARFERERDAALAQNAVLREALRELRDENLKICPDVDCRRNTSQITTAALAQPDDAVKAFLGRVRDEEHSRAVATCLADVEGRSAYEPIASALAERDARVREKAFDEFIKEMDGREPAEESIIQRLAERDARVREEKRADCVAGFVKLLTGGDQPAPEEVTRALAERDARVAAATTASLAARVVQLRQAERYATLAFRSESLAYATALREMAAAKKSLLDDVRAAVVSQAIADGCSPEAAERRARETEDALLETGVDDERVAAEARKVALAGLSKLKRYAPETTWGEYEGMRERDDGDWVKHDDVAALAAAPAKEKP